MALEFALRPRFSLERPAPRPRLRRARRPPLALPIAAYWLAMAGVTHALLRSTAGDSAEGSAEVTAAPHASEVDDAAPSVTIPISPTAAPNVATSPAPLPDFEPAPSS